MDAYYSFTKNVDRRSPRNAGDPNSPYLRENLLSRDGRLKEPRGTEKFHTGLDYDSIDNVLPNGNFEDWGSGTSSAPTGWLSGGIGVSVNRSENKKVGLFSAKITRDGADSFIYQIVHVVKGIAYWKGKTITLSAWVYATVADRARLRIFDNELGSTFSAYHTGNSTWQLLTVTHTVGDTTVTSLEAYMYLNAGDTTAYYDGAILVEGTANPYAQNLTDIVTWKGRYYTVETGQVSPKTFAYTQDGKIWVYNQHGVATLVKEGLNLNAYPKHYLFKTANQTKLFLVDGKDMYVYDGNNDNLFEKVDDLVDVNDNSIKPIDLIEHKDRLWVVSNTDLYVSKNLEPAVFSDATDSFQGIVGSGKGKNKALWKTEDFMFILNTEGIFQVIGDTISAVASTWAIIKKEDRRIISGRTAVDVERGCVFLADDLELYSFDGNSTKLLSYSEKISDMINGTRDFLDKAVAVYEDNYYKLSVVEKGENVNKLEIWWDAFENKIDFVKGRNVSCYLVIDPTEEEVFYQFGRSDVNYTMWADRGRNFDGAAIKWRLTTRDIVEKKGFNLRYTKFYPVIEPTAVRNVFFRYLLDGRLSDLSGNANFLQNISGEAKELGFIRIRNQSQFTDGIRPKINYSRGESIAFDMFGEEVDLVFSMLGIGFDYIIKNRKKGKLGGK